MENPFTRQLKDPETGEWDRREIWARVRGVFAVLLSIVLLVGGGYLAFTKGKEVWESVRAEAYRTSNWVVPLLIGIVAGILFVWVSFSQPGVILSLIHI